RDDIETCTIPTELVGRPIPAGEPAPKRFHPLFRDRDELPATDDLREGIKTALRESRYLIVICSPHSAGAPWVNEEIFGVRVLLWPAANFCVYRRWRSQRNGRTGMFSARASGNA